MYKWKVKSQYNENKSLSDQLLESRGIVSSQEKELFLNPPPVSYWFQRLPKDTLRSLKDARDMVKSSMEKRQVIVIHGDYDADGVCAATLLCQALKGILEYENVHAFIPNRFEHGYGLSENSIEAVLQEVPMEQVDKGLLFITVDCGITSVDEIDHLKQQGHNVIVTDHHQKPDTLPQADCIVWYDQIVGTTISYLLAKVLGADHQDFLAYCCLATVTDLQPVLGFNRTLVKEGLEIMNSNPPLGIKNILSAAGKEGSEVTTYDLGWLIGPRLNATGRIKDANYALEFLLEKDEQRSKEMAWELNKVNTIRQDKTIEMLELAVYDHAGDIPKIIISHNEKYHEGIIGLVASRLSKRYHRPVVVISTSDKIYKGSVRSVRGINIIEALRDLDDDLFLSLGGHPMAAGFSLHKDKLSTLITALEDYARESVDETHLIKELSVDTMIPLSVIDEKLMEQIDMLRPFGMGNRQPVFGSNNVGVAGTKLVGSEQQHLKLRFQFGGNEFMKGIFFNYMDYLEDEIKIGEKVDVTYNIKKNSFNGRTYIDMIIKDIKKV